MALMRLHCPGCRAVFQVPENLIGKSIRCRECREIVRVEGTAVGDAVPVVLPANEPPPQRRIQSAQPRLVPTLVSRADERDDYRAPPRKSSSAIWIIVLLVGGLLLAGVAVVLIGLGALFFTRSSSNATAPDVVEASAPPVEAAKAAPRPRPRPQPGDRPGQLSPEMLAFLKDLTVFVKIDAGHVQGSGSGFLIKVDGDTGYIVTNDHVANPKDDDPDPPTRQPNGPMFPRFGPPGFPRFGPRFGPGLPGMPNFPGMPDFPELPPVFERPATPRKLNAKLSVLFGSGTPAERRLPAEILDGDAGCDLAILRVRGPNLPLSLDLTDRAEVAETMPVYVIGFPLGDELALNRNPEVTIGPATVTSIRRGKTGKPAMVQLHGEIKPGSSGGPVVDGAGRLVGVSAKYVPGTQIGLAVSPQALEDLLHRAKSTIDFSMVRAEAETAEVEVRVQLLDLFDEINELRLVHSPGLLAANIRPAPDGSFSALPNGRPVQLLGAGKTFSARLTVSARELVGDQLTGQLQYVRKDGSTRYGAPFSYRVAFAGRPAAPAPAPAPTPAPAAPVVQAPPAAPPPRLTDTPPPFTPPDVTVALPGPPGTVAVAAAGRLLVVQVPSQKQLSVFDVKEGRIVKSIPTGEDKALFAAGRDALMIFRPDTNQFERWSLTTFERQATAPNPVNGEIKALAMGSASSGPLVVYAPTQKNQKPGLLLFDPVAMKPSDDVIETVNEFFHVNWTPDVFGLGVSGDGRNIIQRYVFNWWVLSKQGPIWRARNFAADTPLPSADGKFFIDHGQAFTLDGKPVAPKRGAAGMMVWSIPAATGGLTVSFNQAYAPGAKEAHLKIMFHVGAEAEPLATFPRSSPDFRELVDWFFGRPRSFERHVFAMPELGAFVVLPFNQNRIDLYRFNLDELLKDSKRDYFFILGSPATEAAKGKAYTYPIAVKSKKGGVKFKLETGPAGMKIADNGTLTWNPPADFSSPEAEVAVSIRDASGQEIRHDFRVSVR